MNSSPTQPVAEKMCPHLGIPSDPQTALGYPSVQNLCYHVTPPAAPGASYQCQFCLEPLHTQCERYVAKSKKPIPAAFLIGEQSQTRKRSLVLRLILLGLMLLAVVAATVWLLFTQRLAEAPALEPTSLTTPAAVVVLATSTLTQTPQPSLTQSPVPSQTAKPSFPKTSTQIPPHLLETPYGIARQFLLHRVVAGESLLKLSGTYNASVEAIRAVNIDLQGTLWADTVIIIPVNQLDANGLIPMIAYEVLADGITIQTLALEQNVDLNVLYELNNLPSDYIFHSGEWVILPHTPSAP